MPRRKLPFIIKYIDPLTDFGFKRLFGHELNKDLLLDLLNSIFAGRKVIVDLLYNKHEHVGDTKEEGSAIYDLTCTCHDGELIIIEVQRGRQANFRQRAIFYTSQLTAGLAPKGRRAEWAYQLPDIYFIAFLEDFSVETESNGRYVQDICLMNGDTGKVFYEGLNYVFLELVNFVKTEEQLESDLDKWLYVLKNMGRMEKIPVYLRKKIFEKLFNIAEYSNLTKEEKDMYNTALKRKWDNQAILDYAVKTAKEEGIKEERAKAEAEKRKILSDAEAERRKILSDAESENRRILSTAEAEKRDARKNTVTALKMMGIPVADIARAVGISQEEVEQMLS